MTAYHQPSNLEGALAILARTPDAVCLAGGQSLVAGMNTGLVRPAALIDLNRIGALRGIEFDAQGGASIGAMTTHEIVAKETRFSGALGLIAEAAGHIAHPAIRTRGTIGGSICHADPAADYPAVLLALDAEIEIVHAEHRRFVPAKRFFTGFLSTDLKPGELVTRIGFPSFDGVGAYEKFCRSEGDFAIVSIALALRVDGGVCRRIGLAVGGCGPTPLRSEEAEALLLGSALDEATISTAGAVLARTIEPVNDVRGSAEYRRLLIPRLVARAIARLKPR
jgi:carbon-monoxide dehydrogenase medium subunit